MTVNRKNFLKVKGESGATFSLNMVCDTNTQNSRMYHNCVNNVENYVKKIEGVLSTAEGRQTSDEKLRPRRVEFSPYVSDKLDEIAKRKGMTHKEALEQLMKTALEVMEKGEEKFRKLVKARGLLTAKEDYGEKKKRKDSKNRET